nr:MAG TPA: hypothetical protein [Caudoviricetes sp.]
MQFVCQFLSCVKKKTYICPMKLNGLEFVSYKFHNY